jgi:hypothetical protein
MTRTAFSHKHSNICFLGSSPYPGLCLVLAAPLCPRMPTAPVVELENSSRDQSRWLMTEESRLRGVSRVG